MTNSQIPLTVIIVNWNTKDLLISCIKSIFGQGELEVEVIVVDNGSTDGSVEAVSAMFGERVFIIKNTENAGFAKANNRGIKKANGRFVLLLNSDTVVKKGTLSGMVSWMDRNPSFGVSTCQLLNSDGSIQETGGYFPTIGRVFGWMFFLDDLPIKLFKPIHPHAPGFYTKDAFYTSEHEMDWVTGAFFLIRREVFENVGYLDENFFMYAEEMEYCFRIKKAGFKIGYVPSVSIIHFGKKSSTTGSSGAILGEYKGLKYFYSKHYAPVNLLILRLLLKAGAALRILLFGIIMRKKEAMSIYAQAFGAA